ncbi:hypothetical protein WA538_003601 [Blastocystis sp. DL]
MLSLYEVNSSPGDEGTLREMTERLFDEGEKEMTKVKEECRQLGSVIKLTTDSEDEDKAVPVMEQSLQPMGAPFTIHYKDLKVLRSLGSGSSGTVKEVVHIPSGELMAVKTMRVTAEKVSRRYLCRELNTLRFTYSPFFIDFYGATIFGETQLLVLMEFMDLGSLDSVRDKMNGALPESLLGKVAFCVLSALDYLHSTLHMLHRDIKPANILLNTKGEIKLSDFGVSGYVDASGAIRSSWSGTTAFMSPERIAGEPYDSSSDVWSLGVTLFMAATGNYPFAANYQEAGYWELFFCIKNNPVPSLPPRFSSRFNDFLQICMRKDPRERATVSSLLKHPFVEHSRKVAVPRVLRGIIQSQRAANLADLRHASKEAIAPNPRAGETPAKLPMEEGDVRVLHGGRFDAKLPAIPESGSSGEFPRERQEGGASLLALSLYRRQVAVREESSPRGEGSSGESLLSASSSSQAMSGGREGSLREFPIIDPIRELPIREESLREESLREFPIREGSLRELPIREESLREFPIREGSLREESLREFPIREGSLRELPIIDPMIDPLRDPSLRDPQRDPMKAISPLLNTPLRDLPLRPLSLRSLSLRDLPSHDLSLPLPSRSLSLPTLPPLDTSPREQVRTPQALSRPLPLLTPHSDSIILPAGNDSLPPPPSISLPAGPFTSPVILTDTLRIPAVPPTITLPPRNSLVIQPFSLEAFLRQRGDLAGIRDSPASPAGSTGLARNGESTITGDEWLSLADSVRFDHSSASFRSPRGNPHDRAMSSDAAQRSFLMAQNVGDMGEVSEGEETAAEGQWPLWSQDPRESVSSDFRRELRGRCGRCMS